MSVYSQPGIKSHYLFPHSFNSNQAEFKLDNETMYYSNLRLAGLGDFRADSDLYNDMSGAYGKIRNIFLTSNGKIIDGLRQAHRYLAFSNLMNDNVHENCVLDRESKSQLGLCVDSDNKVIAVSGGGSNASTTNATAADARDKFLGYLPLHKCFPILASLPVLDTGSDMFPNLTIRIEFETEPLFSFKTQMGKIANDTPQPVLICDEIRDPAQRSQMRAAFQPVVWSSIEHDLVVIPDQITESDALADTASSKQEVDQKMLGFNDKYVSRVVFAKAAVDLAKNKAGTTSIGFGPYASYGGFKEVFNLRVNGANLLPGRGLQNKNAALMLLSDTYGPFGMNSMDNQLSIGSETQQNNATRQGGCRDHTTGASALLSARQNEKVGQLNYYGLSIEDKVQDLQVSFERTIIKNTATGKRHFSYGVGLHAFAEVRKALTMEGGKFMVSYL